MVWQTAKETNLYAEMIRDMWKQLRFPSHWYLFIRCYFGLQCLTWMVLSSKTNLVWVGSCEKCVFPHESCHCLLSCYNHTYNFNFCLCLLYHCFLYYKTVAVSIVFVCVHLCVFVPFPLVALSCFHPAILLPSQNQNLPPVSRKENQTCIFLFLHFLTHVIVIKENIADDYWKWFSFFPFQKCWIFSDSLGK